MTATKLRRLPGFAFETRAQVYEDVLPRMDVPVFAGFAASGPVNSPVPVEDVAQFTAVFGADAPLAWDAELGHVVYAQLAPAVRMFFANGGRRCWIVRLTGHAESNKFPVPGIVTVDAHGAESPLELIARSPGSWSDGVMLSASMTSERFGVLAWDAAKRELEVFARNDSALSRGDLLRLTWRDASVVLYIGVDSVEATHTAVRAGARRARLVVHGGVAQAYDLNDSPLAPSAIPTTIPGVERLALTLWARTADGGIHRLDDLGMAPGHARHVALLPDDDTVYGSVDWSNAATWRDVIAPRFPVAGNGNESLCVPRRVGALPEQYLNAQIASGTPLERDGLVPFEAAIFGDAELADSRTTTLLTDAEYVRFLAPMPRPTLTGLHAALAIDEATLIAIPDAAQGGWTKQERGSPLPPEPASVDVENPCIQDDFLDCGAMLQPGPMLTVSVDEANGAIDLDWTEAPSAAPYVVEESASRDWRDAAEIFRGDTLTRSLFGHRAGDFYFRVRGVGSHPTDWSNGVAVRVAAGQGFRTLQPTEYSDDVLIAVHRMLLRFCGARRDVMAVLSLPEHYRDDDAETHVQILSTANAPAVPLGASTTVPALGTGELDSLGFAALYHGWIYTRDEDGLIRSVSPDGPVCGTIAHRSIERGPWVAPANERIEDVIALVRPTPPARQQDLLQRQINVVRQDPRGFMVMSADTLALDDDVRPINVRRLLILLRRVATRLGATYVFEPNDDSFRRMVQRGFEAMLGTLFERGAFAGKTPATAFQVVTDATINTPQSVDLGRFIVELRVAPSRPLEFLTLRLVQTGERIAVTGA